MTTFIVNSATTTAEPGSPSAGDRYILPSGKTGTNWAPKPIGSVARYNGSAWIFTLPTGVDAAIAADTGVFYRWIGSAWVDASVTISGSGGTFSDGSVGAPGVAFTSDLDNGLYRIGTNHWGLAAGGTKVADVSTDGIQVLGLQGSTAPSAGYFGELIESSIAIGSAVSAASNTATDITSLVNLSIGSWLVLGTVFTTPASGGITSQALGWINTGSASIPTAPNGGGYGFFNPVSAVDNAANVPGLFRIYRLNTPTTIFLGGRVIFTGGSGNGSLYGYIGAHRIN